MPDSSSAIQEQITADLLDLGVRPGGVLLVHASLRSMGILPGGAETVVRALLSALGEEGTLLMPALSYLTVGRHYPYFDALQTPSCVGALPEYFRTRPGTQRSIHPTHSVCAVGARAEALLARHEEDVTPCGAHSPFSKLPGVDGQILFLGCGLSPNTSMHAIEEHVTPPYLFARPVDYTIRMPSGEETRMTVTSHNFVGYTQRYDRLGGVMGREGLRAGTVLAASSSLVETGPMWRAALAAYQSDPLYFVEQNT